MAFRGNRKLENRAGPMALTYKRKKKKLLPHSALKVPPNVWTIVSGLLKFELYNIRLKVNNLFLQCLSFSGSSIFIFRDIKGPNAKELATGYEQILFLFFLKIPSFWASSISFFLFASIDSSVVSYRNCMDYGGWESVKMGKSCHPIFTPFRQILEGVLYQNGDIYFIFISFENNHSILILSLFDSYTFQFWHLIVAPD